MELPDMSKRTIHCSECEQLTQHDSAGHRINVRNGCPFEAWVCSVCGHVHTIYSG